MSKVVVGASVIIIMVGARTMRSHSAFALSINPCASSNADGCDGPSFFGFFEVRATEVASVDALSSRDLLDICFCVL